MIFGMSDLIMSGDHSALPLMMNQYAGLVRLSSEQPATDGGEACFDNRYSGSSALLKIMQEKQESERQFEEKVQSLGKNLERIKHHYQ